MRLFIGVGLDDDATRRVRVSADGLSRRLRDSGCAVQPRWVPDDNLHITLWFLGEISEGTAESVVAAMAPPLAVPAFPLELRGFGVFPPSGAPRVVWLAVQRGLDDLALLHARLADRLEPLGFEPESRPFSAHLTLARVARAERRDLRRLREVVRTAPGDPVRTSVDGVTVYRSQVSSKGAAYTALVRVPLG